MNASKHQEIFEDFENTTKKTSVPQVFFKSWENLFCKIRCYHNAILLKLNTTMCANVDRNEVPLTLYLRLKYPVH